MKGFYLNFLKKNGGFIPLILIAVASFLLYFSNLGLTEREKYEQFLNQHEYSQRRGLCAEELKEIPKADRPDLAWEQDYLMTMDPNLGYPPVERLRPVYKYVQEFRNLKAGIPGDGVYDWVERGPNNVAGRVRALMFDPNDVTNKKVWSGGVSGGLWYNNDITDVNSSWNVIDDFWSNLAISSIINDPSNTQIFYVGTGEGWYNADAVDGAGIWKTNNGGTSWAQLASTDNSNFTSVQKIVITSSGRIVAGTNAGILISDDGGTSWSNKSTGFVSDIEIASNGTLFAGKGRLYGNGFVLKSTDSGNIWIDISPLTSTQERVELAVAPSNSDIVYAVTSDGSDVSWFKKSIDGGSNWADITIPMYLTQSCVESTTDDFTRSQAWYDLILAVHPTNPDIVFAGGIDVNKSTNGGDSWSTITYWTGACAPYSHADQHSIVFRPGNNDEAIVGSDGGVSYSNDIGSSNTPAFAIMNKGFNITQFYAGAIHPDAMKNYFLAGSQDNGSQQFKSTGVNSTTEVSGGDGAFCFIDQKEPDIQITSFTGNTYTISKDGGQSFSLMQSDNDGKFINPAAYDNDLHILYSAKNTSSLNRVLNVNDNPQIGSVSISGLGSTASHIKVSQYTTGSSTIFVGTGSGKVFKVANAEGDSPSSNEITGTSFPNGNISCIEIGANEDELLVTFSNYGVSSIWYTNDGGTSWLNREGDLPDMPVRWALFNPNDRTQVILATEVGVWSTSNFGVTSPNWSSSVSGLANVRTDMLLLRESDYEVLAVTHGRGLYTNNGFSNVDNSALAAYFSVDGATHIFPGSTVKFEDLSIGSPTTWSWSFEGGTPASSSDQNPTINYDTPGVYEVSLTVGDGVNSESTIRTAYIHVSESGGWTTQATAFSSQSRGIDFISVVDDKVIWAQAYDGTNSNNRIKEFTKTTNGGLNWTPGTIDISGDIYPAMMHAQNANTAWIPMYPTGSTEGGIYITKDGGTTWVEQPTASFSGSDAFANVVYFWNKDEGFCMGDPNGGYFEIYTTSDGGNNWLRVDQANIPAPSATDEYGTTGQFCVADDGVAFFNTTKGRIYKSTDKGASWTVITTPLSGRTRIAFADENNGFIFNASNSNNAYYTTDGGTNWIGVSDNDLFDSFLEYVPGTEKMYVSSSANTTNGAGVSYSIDGGKTWKKFNELEDQQCLAIGFYDMTKGWVGQFNASSANGGILKYNGTYTIPGFTVNPEVPERNATVIFTDITLSQESGLTYLWDFGADATPATADNVGPHDVTYSTTGTKTVTLTVNGQDVVEDIEVAIPTSIESEFAKYDLSIYPNPNNGQFNLKIKSDKSADIYLEIYGMNGQIVYFNKFAKGSGIAEFSINLENVHKGIYIMKVFDGDRYLVKKILVR